MKSRDLLSIPLVNKHGTLVGLETLQHLLEKKRYNNPVFLMAGGFGTRLHPLTEIKPKPLLNVCNRPILETIINQFIEAGFHNFYISTHYKADMIREFFGDGANWGIKIEYLHEKIPLGTAGSLGLLPDNMPDLPIIMMNGDVLTKVNFEHLLDFHLKKNGIVTMCIREYDVQIPFGVVSIKDQKALNFSEKPVKKFFVNAGIYVLNPSMLDTIDGISYLDMPNLLEEKISDLGQINMFPVHEYWLDIGQMEQFDKAQRDQKLFYND